uniref:STAS domain-containing protein n=1 Tax=Capra hircus TaxID=9925 RepID=A0A8C2SDH5_CAPHI
MQPDRSFQSSASRYRQSSFTYDVKRDVYNEENFQQEHRKKTASSGNVDIDISTVSHHVECRCSWYKFRRCLLTVFPFLEWMCFYRFKDWLLGDLLAGISVGLVQIPQVLMLGLLARHLIPPLNVSYAAFCASVIYGIFGSCHQMSIGTFFLVSALTINVLRTEPFNSGHLLLGTFIQDDFSNITFYENYNRSLSSVASVTLLTGIIQLSMGMLGFGFIVTYIPEAAISGYLAATALHIMLSQLTCIFGVMISYNSGPIAFFYVSIAIYCPVLPETMGTSILGFAAFSNKVNMATENSLMLIEMIPYSFLFPVTPDMSNLTEVLAESFSLALVSSFLLIFLGKKIASFHNYDVNSNQDLIAIGLCNVVSSFFRSYVFTGAVARTIIQDKTGGRQQFASLVGAGLMLLLMMKMAHFFYKLPNAIVAGIILSNVLPYLEVVYTLPSLWRQNQYDCLIWMVTFMSAILLGLDIGLVVAVTFAFFIITVQSHRTKILLLGQIPNTNIYRSFQDYREVANIPGVKIFQCCNAITFVNVHYLKRKVLEEIEMVKMPLTDEEIYTLFSPNEEGAQRGKICRCYCNCDEPEPSPRVIYTERYEVQRGRESSFINLVRCSRFESVDTGQSMSEDQVPYITSSSSQRNPNYEEVEKVWLSDDPSRSMTITLPEASDTQVRATKLLPYSTSTVLPSVHTIILDFSMVHLVDAQALVVLRQVSTKKVFTRKRFFLQKQCSLSPDFSPTFWFLRQFSFLSFLYKYGQFRGTTNHTVFIV